METAEGKRPTGSGGAWRSGAVSCLRPQGGFLSHPGIHAALVASPSNSPCLLVIGDRIRIVAVQNQGTVERAGAGQKAVVVEVTHPIMAVRQRRSSDQKTASVSH
jgi:hypothetical protein